MLTRVVSYRQLFFLSPTFGDMIDIKDTSSNTLRFSTEIKEGSIYRYTLMKEEYILLKFSVEDPVYFRLGDYVDIPEGLFEVVDLVFPVYNKTTGGYDYDLRLDAPYWKWKHKILFYDRQKGKEAKWSLTQTPDVHLSIVTSNLASLGYTYKGKPIVFSLDATVEIKAIFIQYDSTNIIDAITEIAKACDCEWWVKENYIFLGRCEDTINSIVPLEIGNELSAMSRSDSTSTYATRIYAFGSDRNIPKNYRPDSDDVVIEGVVQKRLKLPEGIPYIDAYPDMSEEEAVESVLFFDQIYPKRIGTLSDVAETRGYIVDDNDQPTSETYPIFTIKDAGLKDFKEEYVLNELRLVFQSGRLNGLDFAVELKTSDSTGTTFEIVRNEDYGQYLPNDVLKPAVDDTYILHGYDISFVSDTLIGEAEQELLRETQKYVEKSKIDPSVFTCPTDPVRCAGYINDVYHYTDEIDLPIGQRVKLINPAFFKDGRVSRIYGFEKKLDNKFECTYTVGESTQYSRIGEIENRLDELKYNGDTYVPSGSGGGGIYVIKTNDPTPPTDQNVYSALMTDKKIQGVISQADKRFLRKDIDDIAHGNILFDQKIGSSIFLEGYDGKGWEIKETGSALLDSAQVRSDIFMGGKIGSPSFASGFTGWGWEIDTPTASGTVDNWTVRKSMKVYEMVYSQVYGLNSSFLVSEWNKIKSVTPLGSNRYRCEIDDMEGEMFVNLRNGDIVRTQKRDGWNIRYFASEVENVTMESFDLKVIEGTDSPQVGDYVQRIGSKVDKNRQGLIYFTSSDDYAPYIDILDEVTGSQFTENNTKVRIGNLRGIRINGQPLDIHGIYINGGIFEHSTYYMEDGNTIEQQFAIIDGKLMSEIEGVRNDISGEKGNILRNSSFASNLNYWTTASNVHFIPVMGGFMWLPSAFYVDKEAVSDIYRDGSRNVLRIRNNRLTQINGVLNLPKHGEASKDGLYTYSFSFHYKVLRAGTLTAGIKESELYTTQSLTESEEYQLLFHEGMWNEQGDFELSFTGEILIYGATLRNDSSADAFIYMKTGIEQSEEKIRLWATKEIKDSEGRIYIKYDGELKVTSEQISAVNTRVDNINNRINTAGWITTADSVNIFAQELNKTGIKNSIANLQVKYNEISSTVSGNEQDIVNVRNLANSAANQAQKAMGVGIYGQEQYSQSSNPWDSWQSGTEYKHVGALWYNASTGVTKRYTGTDGSNSWETVSNSAITAASYVLQNKDVDNN